MLNKQQLKDFEECVEMEERGEEKDCGSCSCSVCIGQQPDYTEIKMKKWFNEQIAIAEEVKGAGYAVALILKDGLKKLIDD